MRELSYKNRRRRNKTAARKRRAERMERYVAGYPRPYSDTGRYTKRHLRYYLGATFKEMATDYSTNSVTVADDAAALLYIIK